MLKDQMKDVKDALSRIETKLDSDAKTYATKSELKSFKWITVPTVILLTATLTALVLYYLSHGHYLSPETTASTGSTSAGVPSANASATSHSDTATPTDSQASSSGGTVSNTLKQVGL